MGTIGGSHHSLLQLIRTLDRKIYSPYVVFYEKNDLVEEFLRSNSFVLYFDRDGRNNQKKQILQSNKIVLKISKLRRFFICILNAIHIIKENNIQIVHLNNNPFNCEWIIACRICGIPCVSHYRGIHPPKNKFKLALGKSLKKIFCISKAVLNSLSSSGFPLEKLQLVYNGLDPDTFIPQKRSTPLRERLGIKNGPVVGIVGNIKEWKGQLIFIEAIANLIFDFPGITGVIVGGFSEEDFVYASKIKQVVRERDLQNNIIFSGYTKDVPSYINVLDLVVHASIKPEPFGRVLIEAMALGKPVIGARDGGVLEIIDEPNCGITFTPGKSDELANIISGLLKNPERMAKMGENGRIRVQNYFNSKNNSKIVISIYSNILQENN